MLAKSEPHNVEAEQQVLGALLCNNDLLHRVADILKAEHFYEPVHADLFKAISGRIRRDHMADISTLAPEFRDHEGLKELGGLKYLARMAGSAISTFAIRDYGLQVADASDRRDLLEVIREAEGDINRGDKDAAAISGALEAHLLGQTRATGNGLISFKDAVLQAAQEAADAYKADGLAGATTGIVGLDNLTGGMFPGDFIVIGGRPSMGKTAVALSMALGCARAGGGVAIASLEMSASSLAMRAISEATPTRGSGIAYTDARKGNVSQEQAEQFVLSAQDIASLPIQIIPPTHRDIGAIYASAKRAAKIFEGQGRKMEMLVVDYLQLIRSNKQSRIDQISEISMALKGLAMQLGIPVVALSQLSRAVESREDKRPVMSDLRESGQIEQDADLVMFCYRDEYYLAREEPNRNNIEEHDAWRSCMDEAHGQLDLIVAKQRMGDIGTVRVNFNPAFNRIWEDSL